MSLYPGPIACAGFLGLLPCVGGQRFFQDVSLVLRAQVGAEATRRRDAFVCFVSRLDDRFFLRFFHRLRRAFGMLLGPSAGAERTAFCDRVGCLCV